MEKQYSLLGPTVNLEAGGSLPEQTPSTSAGSPQDLPSEGNLDNGWLGIWVFRFLIFYGSLFSCFAVIAVRLAAIPQHILLFTRAETPSFAGAFTFMIFQWMLCLQALHAQVLWNFMASMVSNEKPLATFRTACARELSISVSFMDFLLVLSFAITFAVFHFQTTHLYPHVSLFQPLSVVVYIFSWGAVVIRQCLSLRAKYAGNSRAQLWQQLEYSQEDEYRGLRLALLVFVAQCGLGVVGFAIMRTGSVSALHTLFCTVSLITLPCLMTAFSWVFNHSIYHRTELGNWKDCCPHAGPGCGSFFSIICILCGILMLFVYVMESTLLEAKLYPDMSHGKAFVLTGGREWDPEYESESEKAFLGSYPVCKMSFGSNKVHHLKHHLTPLDLAVFAQVTYKGNLDALHSVVQNAFAGTELPEYSLVVPPQDPQENARVVHFRLPNASVDVIAIRGSTLARDWAYNAYLWAPGVFWNIFMNLAMPFGLLMPVEIGQFFLSQEIIMGSNIESNLYVTKLRYIEARVEQARRDGFTPILTGHSLGGGVAQTAGALFGVTTLTFSPVGLTYTEGRVRRAMSMTEKRDDPVMNNIVSVVPVGDPVPLLEPQTGMVQEIHCGVKPITDGDPGACHSLERTICELHRKCGDPRGRRADYCVKDGYSEALPWQQR